MKAQHTKHQNPEKLQIQNTKTRWTTFGHRARTTSKRPLGAWGLEILWCLVFTFRLHLSLFSRTRPTA